MSDNNFCRGWLVKRARMVLMAMTITFSDRVDYAQFMHDASEVQIKQPRHVSGALRKDVPASLMLPVTKPNVEIPVVEMFLK